MFCPSCGTQLPPASAFCFQCGGKLPSTSTADAPPPAAPEAKGPEAAAAPSAPGRSRLAEDAGALGCSVLLFFGGGALAVMEDRWGSWALIVGGILAIVGLISGNATFWAILKRLGKK